MTNSLNRFLNDKVTRERAMFTIENWRTQKSLAFEFQYAIEAMRRKLLTKEETKKLMVEIGLWLAQEDAIKKRKPRGDEADVRAKLCRHRQWSKAYRKTTDRLEALQAYNMKNDMRQWLPQDNASKRLKARNTKLKMINGYTEYCAATEKTLAASNALKDFKRINEVWAWLAEEDAINLEEPHTTKTMDVVVTAVGFDSGNSAAQPTAILQSDEQLSFRF